MVALIFCELLFFSVAFDSRTDQLLDSARWYSWLAYSGGFAKLLVAIFATFFLAIWNRRGQVMAQLLASLTSHKYRFSLCLQVLIFLPFLICSGFVFGDYYETGFIPTPVVLGWFVLLFLVCLFWGLAFAPLSYWRKLVFVEKIPIAICLVVGFFAWGIALYSQNLWGPLGELTFASSSVLLSLFYSEILIDPSRNLLGVGDFVVQIAAECSGYEGIGLVILFTTFYLTMFKKEFRFPQVLLLFPIGIVAIWCLNVVRIVFLIVIGDKFSVEVAVGGFHSQAGWIFFLLVIFGLLVTAHRVPLFSSQPSERTHKRSDQKRRAFSLPVALLLPFVVLMTSIVITSAFSADFIWLYPVRVIAVIAVLLLCWRSYSFSRYKFRLEPILAGIGVFLVWVLVVPNDVAENLAFSEALSSAAGGFVYFWLAFRFIGAVITVPLVEELLFRGYLLPRLAKRPIVLEGAIEFSWVGLLLSSCLFGILHNSSMAGVLAGLIYGLVRYRSTTVMDTVVAHAVTNLLLSVFVLSTGYWSMW